VAVTVEVPSGRAVVDNDACNGSPVSTSAFPRFSEPSVNVTDPVGVPPEVDAISAVNWTG
jgi:hypothetical protein